jgi:hypothetical protein
MSRVSDDWDDYDPLADGRWRRNSVTTLKSKRGQKALREIEAALLALPEPKLAYETFHKVEQDDSGRERVECCVLGAFARHKGVVGELPEYVNGDEYGPGDPADQASWAEEHLGLAFTLAWNLIALNDDDYESETDEQRYERVLAYVRKHMAHDERSADEEGHMTWAVIARKKPVEVEAMRVGVAPTLDIVTWMDGQADFRTETHPTNWHQDVIYIKTLEGEMRADPGDWIIKGVKGEFYPCKPDIFEATYDVVSTTASEEGR